MNLFPKAWTAVTEIRQHPAYLYYNTLSIRSGEDYKRFLLMRTFADMVDRNPGRYANGIALEAFISDFPTHPVAMDALELLKKMRVYKVSDDVLLPLKVWKPKGHRTTTCISLPTHLLNALRDHASVNGKTVSGLIAELVSTHLGA